MTFLEFYAHHQWLMPGIDHSHGLSAFYAIVRQYNTLAIDNPEKYPDIVKQVPQAHKHPSEWAFAVISDSKEQIITKEQMEELITRMQREDGGRLTYQEVMHIEKMGKPGNDAGQPVINQEGNDAGGEDPTEGIPQGDPVTDRKPRRSKS